jgi:hypothetical protein
LLGSSGCPVDLTTVFDDLETVAEDRRQPFCAVASHRKTRAALRSIWSKRSEDDRPTRSQRPFHGGSVDIDVPLGEEVEYRPIVPEVVSTLGLPDQKVADDPVHPGIIADSMSAGAQSSLGDVEDRQVDEASPQKTIHKDRGPTSDIDHRSPRTDAERIHELQG